MMGKRARIVLVLPLVFAALSAPVVAADKTGEDLVAPAAPAPAAAPASSLTGTPWRLAELTGEPWPEGAAAPYLFFADPGELAGFGGCNYFVGKLRTEADGKLVVSSLRATHRQCPDELGREATLLTSLVLANGLELETGRLTFLLDGTPLMKLGEAPEISTAEVTEQGKLLKAKKTRKHKARGKKKKGGAKTGKPGKKRAAKTAAKVPRTTAKPNKKK